MMTRSCRPRGNARSGVAVTPDGNGKKAEAKEQKQPHPPKRRTAQRLQRDRFLASASAHRRGRIGDLRIQGPRFGHLLERLGACHHARLEIGLGYSRSPEREGTDGASVPAAIPARGGSGGNQSRREQRVRQRAERGAQLRHHRYGNRSEHSLAIRLSKSEPTESPSPFPRAAARISLSLSRLRPKWARSLSR